MLTTIALDASGGDYAPKEIIAGAALAARPLGLKILLVGQEKAIQSELDRLGKEDANFRRDDFEIIPAEESIEMSDSPASAVRQKPNSPPVVGARLVKEGRAQAFVSAGSTGAVMASALFALGRIRGIERPALATLFPTANGRCLLLDVGANVDSRPLYLLQFAVMGSIYAEKVMRIAKPRVGLLSIGEEKYKGNAATVEAHRLLSQMTVGDAENGPLNLNFIGNVEGKDVPLGLADVVVTDGFAGNVALKMAEGMGSLFLRLLRSEVNRSLIAKLGGLLLKPALKNVVNHFDYEEYGGAPLLGLNGLTIVAHGRSKSRAIQSALRVAKDAVDVGLVDLIKSDITRLGQVGKMLPDSPGPERFSEER